MSTQAVTKQNALFPSLFDDFFKAWRDWPIDFNSGRSLPAVTIPAVNVSEDSDKYNISMAAPGMKKEDFKIDLNGNVLTISAETEETKDEKNEKFSRQEYNYSSLSRSFNLPETIKKDKIEARYQNGVLSLQLPKKEEARQDRARVHINVQ